MIDANRYPWAEQRSGNSDELLARIVDASADALVVVTRDGRMTLLNAAAERLLGIPREQLTGQPSSEPELTLLTLEGKPMPVEDRPTTRVLETGEAVSAVDVLVERPTGDRILLLAHASPLVDAEGHVTGVVVSLRDETARNETDDGHWQHAVGLRAQAELLDLAHDALFVRDMAASRILYWNRGAEEVYGYRRDEAVGAVSHELLHTQFPLPLQEIEEAMVRAGQWEGELVHRTREGRELIIESRWALQRDAQGKPVAFLEINRDITARKQAEAALAQQLEELARANAEITRRHREMTAVNTSMAAISRSLDLPEVLHNIVDAARELIQAQYAALGVADGHGRIIQFLTSGITPEQRTAIGPLPQGHGLLGTLIKDATPVRVRSMADDPRSHGFPPHHPPMTSVLGVPILSRGRAVGNLYLTDKIGAQEFSEEDQTLLLLLARHAAVAIENGQLYEDVRAARDQLRSWNRDLEAIVAERTRQVAELHREMTARVLEAQEEERGRIARELHDETAQTLSRLLIDLDLARPYIAEDGPARAMMTRLEQGLSRTLEEVRALSHDLRPAILEDFGLAATIQSYAEDWMQTFGVPIQLELHPGSSTRLPPEVEIALFRIAQEALMNAGKYAQATAVQVSLTFGQETVRLVVADDGKGFDPENLAIPTRQSGLGLYGMRERAALLGGTVTIGTAPGQGTRIMLVAPFPGSAPAAQRSVGQLPDLSSR